MLNYKYLIKALDRIQDKHKFKEFEVVYNPVTKLWRVTASIPGWMYDHSDSDLDGLITELNASMSLVNDDDEDPMSELYPND